jgi:hypothetical protein
MAVHVLGRKKNLKFKINNLAQKSQKGWNVVLKKEKNY